MKKKLNQMIISMVLVSVLFLPIVAQAASLSVSYSFHKTVSVNTAMKATKSTLSGTVSVAKWGTPSFWIKLYKRNSILDPVTYIGSRTVYQNGTRSFSFGVTTGNTYRGEFWKDDNNINTVGTATFSY